MIGSLGQAVVESDLLDDEARRIERIALGLRTSDGIPLELLDGTALGRVEWLVAEGLARVTADRLQLVRHGRALVDPIVAELI
jgi:oxygen-independent coproporphyrinogen-3 oxidase